MMKIAKQTACAVWCGKTMVDGLSGWSVYWPDMVLIGMCCPLNGLIIGSGTVLPKNGC